MLKRLEGYVVVVLWFLLAATPSFSVAQTSKYSWNFYQDGATTTGSIRQQQIIGYRQQSSDLRQKISALPEMGDTSVHMPVLFGVGTKDISPNFGDPRDGGARMHEGEDIIAVNGTPVVSPTAAVVLRTVTVSGGGNAVYTANPGGETFVYMHIDRFGEGVMSGLVLQEGSIIGYVGNTGNASGGPAHLHFEIHNSANAPTDPFPRLTSEFSIQEKMSFLSTIFTQTSDSTTLARFLVTNFRDTFLVALASNITLPVPIVDALASILAVPATTNGGTTLPSGDLGIGSSGVAVVALQKYLIQAASGVAATRLSVAGATGYFGVITKATLVEFQTANGISPQSGYYGAITRAFIAKNPLVGQVAQNIPPASGGYTTQARDLYRGVYGEDVLALQKLLNSIGYPVASAGLDSAGMAYPGAPGNETSYFGLATEAAVAKFQITHGVSPSVGYVGPLTRAAFASL